MRTKKLFLSVLSFLVGLIVMTSTAFAFYPGPTANCKIEFDSQNMLGVMFNMQGRNYGSSPARNFTGNTLQINCKVISSSPSGPFYINIRNNDKNGKILSSIFLADFNAVTKKISIPNQNSSIYVDINCGEYAFAEPVSVFVAMNS